MRKIPPTGPPRRQAGRSFFVVILIAAIFFAAGFALGQREFKIRQEKFVPKVEVINQAQPEQITVDFGVFWDVWNRVNNFYLGKKEIDPVQLLYGATSGLVEALGDPYSAFLTPEQNKLVKSELAGVYEGVGIQLGAKDSKIVIVAPLAGTPAEVAGVKPGDEILKIGQKDAIGMSLPEAVSLIRGPAGSKVRLTLVRGQQPAFEVELARAKITVKSVEVKIEDNIAIVKLSRFGEQTNSEWDSVISQILTANPTGVILDVRNNPGGFLQGAVYVASEFVGGRIVGQEVGGKKEFFGAERKGKLLKKPLVVLINGGSASAAEIVAAAIFEKNRGKLVGETTFGKGTVQDAQELAEGAGLHITVAKWLTPSGRDINDNGLKPDVEIEAGEGEEDLILKKGLEVLKGML